MLLLFAPFNAVLLPTLLDSDRPEKGYWAGGLNIGGDTLSTIDGIEFTTDTAINPAATLHSINQAMSGVNAPMKGYIAGGWTRYTTTNIDGFEFATEACALISAHLSKDRYGLASVGSKTVGYWGGGYQNGTLNDIDGLTFETETALNPAAVLSPIRMNLAGVSSEAKGYWGGGTNGQSGVLTSIDFTTEAVDTLVEVLEIPRKQHASASSTTKGYFGGGLNDRDNYASVVESFDFATEVAATTASVLSVPTYGLAAAESSNSGYFGSGSGSGSGPTGRSTGVERMDFATETSYALAAQLVQGLYRTSAVSCKSLGSSTDDLFYKTVLIKADGVGNTTTFIDNGPSGYALTRNGEVAQGTFGPFADTAAGSLYFDGYGDVMNIDSAINLSDSDYTIEAFVYFDGPTGSKAAFLQSVSGTGNWYPDLYLGRSTSNGLIIGMNGQEIHTSVALPSNEWQHIALVGIGAQFKIYLNGVEVYAYNHTPNSAMLSLFMGKLDNFRGYLSYFKGYVSDLRITKAAVYTENFPALTAPLDVIANTVLMIKGNNSAIYDAGCKANVTGDSVGSDFNKFSKSIEFSGSDYLILPKTDDLVFGTGDFTVECWSYLTQHANDRPCIYSNYDAFYAGALALFAGHASANADKYQVAVGGRGFPAIQSSASVVYNAWTHLALVSKDGILTLYVNGLDEGSTTSGDFTGVGNRTFIGTNGDTIASGCLKGFLEGVRITKAARYAGNFAVPSKAFPTK